MTSFVGLGTVSKKKVAASVGLRWSAAKPGGKRGSGPGTWAPLTVPDAPSAPVGGVLGGLRSGLARGVLALVFLLGAVGGWSVGWLWFVVVLGEMSFFNVFVHVGILVVLIAGSVFYFRFIYVLLTLNLFSFCCK